MKLTPGLLLVQVMHSYLRVGCRSRMRQTRKLAPILRDLNVLLLDVSRCGAWQCPDRCLTCLLCNRRLCTLMVLSWPQKNLGCVCCFVWFSRHCLLYVCALVLLQAEEHGSRALNWITSLVCTLLVNYIDIMLENDMYVDAQQQLCAYWHMENMLAHQLRALAALNVARCSGMGQHTRAFLHSHVLFVFACCVPSRIQTKGCEESKERCEAPAAAGDAHS